MFRAHGARYGIEAQVHECTNLLWADLGGKALMAKKLTINWGEADKAPETRKRWLGS